MTSDNNDAYEVTLPKKLRNRIDQHQESTDEGETIISNGDIALTSERPVAVVEHFLCIQRSQWSDATFADYGYDLTRFLEYLEFADITDISTLSSRDIEGFKQWRQRDANIVLATLHAQLSNIRVFILWCERIEIVNKGLADEMELPELEPSDIVSRKRISADTATQIRDYHEDLDYVPQRYAMFSLIWGTMMRRGELRALDLEDYHRDKGYIEIKHRPEQGTPLKNGKSEVEGEGGEREVNLPAWVCAALNKHIDGCGDPNKPKREESTDEFDRQPLFTTSNGRVSVSTVYRRLNQVTQPCWHGADCPEDRNPETCEWRNNNNKLNKCPASTSPHPVRRGAICHYLNKGVSKDIICERADLSRPVLNRHYDLRTQREARRQRRQELRKYFDGYEEVEEEVEEDVDTDNISEIESTEGELSAGGELNFEPTAALNQQINSRIVKGSTGFIAYILLFTFDIWLISLNGFA